MKWAGIGLTKGAVSLLKKIKETNNQIDLYVLDKFKEEDIGVIKGSLKEFVGVLIKEYDVIVFVMATGIVVRMIADHIVHKSVDPAVLVLDEKGAFVISLLSGHLGGANDMAKKLASDIGAVPVITTASDVNNSIAVDTLAMKLNCHILNMNSAKDITAMIVNGEEVGIISEIPIAFDLPKNIELITIDKQESKKGIIYIGNKTNMKFIKPVSQIVPRNIVLGIGCRRGTTKEKIFELIQKSFKELQIHLSAINTISTVDVKKDEIGILDIAKHFKAKLDIINRSEIAKIEHKFESSDFVKKTIGVGAVCEPCGYIASKQGKCLLKKTKLSGVTLSVWEEDYE
ncbi:cobalt-precorrin 5A hydrolase [Abyssisolibacter fermentans]|uniref:cobalt-precorrin 5A hydrolase n=1 Tax=Abyssisolibacter fermentans TaxID=1766203 RepID=UPI0008322209|nr:cobalt-precorrin 5A hydrolase [Abyssisolibacter fermentans]